MLKSALGVDRESAFSAARLYKDWGSWSSSAICCVASL